MMTSAVMKNMAVWSITITFLFACATKGGSETERSRWKVKFDGSASSPVIVDGVLYVGSRDGSVYAFDPSSGETKWRFQTGEGLKSMPEITTVPRGSSIAEMLRTIPETRGKKEVVLSDRGGDP